MKKVINGKVYDTSTAQLMGSDGDNFGSFSAWSEELYQKKTGEFFLYGEGGPASRYARSTGDNSWSGGEKIIPLTNKAAREWAEEHLDGDDYERIFGLPDEAEEPVYLNVQIPAQLMAVAKAKAVDHGTSLKSVVVDALTEYLK